MKSDEAQKQDENTAAVIGLVWVLPGLFIRGALFATLCRWFLTPLGVPYFSNWHGAGLLMVYGVLSYEYEEIEKSDTAKTVKRITLNLLMYLTMYLFALLVKAFAGL